MSCDKSDVEHKQHDMLMRGILCKSLQDSWAFDSILVLAVVLQSMLPEAFRLFQHPWQGAPACCLVCAEGNRGCSHPLIQDQVTPAVVSYGILPALHVHL